MNIVFLTDDRYFKYLCVTVESIYINNKDKRINFYILTNGSYNKLDADKIKFLKKKYHCYNFFYIDTELFYPKNFYSKVKLISSHVSINAYDRICIPKIIDSSKALYLDLDLVVNGCIEELYNTDLKNYWAGVVRDSLLAYDISEDQINFLANIKKA